MTPNHNFPADFSSQSLSSSDDYVTDLTARHVSPFPDYSENVPINGIADDAISKQLSKSKSRISTIHTNMDEEEDIESTDKKEYSKEKETEITSVQSISQDAKFNRFLNKQKGIYVAIASLSCFLSPMSGLAFLPAVPEIAERFNTTGEIINISAAVYCVFMAILPCIFSPLSDIYGRRISFLGCMVAYCICTVLVAVSVNLAMFFVFRAFTALFATAFFSIGAHIVSDLCVPLERGKSMSWILSGTQLGTAIGGVIGGIIVNYTSWRVIFAFLAAIGFLIFLPGLFFLPETMVQTKHEMLLVEVRKSEPERKFVFVWFNPLRVILALRYPTLFIDGFVVMGMLYNMYSLLTPIRYVMNPRFDLTEPLYSGLFYLAPGFGYFVGTFFGGRWADHVVKKWIKKRGRRLPEDRLRQVVLPLTVVYPISILIYGWSIEKEFGGVAVPVIFMFLSGVSQTSIFPAVNTYCLDSMPELHGDGIASSYFSRFLAAAVGSATCLRSINHIGVGWSCTISALILWVCLGLNFVLIFWGEDMRLNSLVKRKLRSREEVDSILRLKKNEPKYW